MKRLIEWMTSSNDSQGTRVFGRWVNFELYLVVILLLITLLPITALSDPIARGKALAMERSKGNCLACHAIADGKLPGNLGPPLFAMKARFPDADDLQRQIWDATVKNPQSRMPPFGRHGILSREEIDLIVVYLYTL